MPASITQYLLESSFCLLVFYAFYHAVLRRETFFQLNRGYLLLTALLSLLIPLLNIRLHRPSPGAEVVSEFERVLAPAVSDIQEVQTIIWSPMDEPVSGHLFTWSHLFLGIYILGAGWMALILGRRLWTLVRLIRRSRRQRNGNLTLVHTQGEFPAASFFGYIFWNADQLKERETILQHELVHIRQWHSLDVLLMELMVVLKWFNPLIYWYRRSLRATHEYIADAYVVRRSGQAYQYAALLARYATGAGREDRLVNTFTSLLKMRLLMLGKPSSHHWNRFKYLLSLPLIAALFLLFSFNLADKLPGSGQLDAAEQYLDRLGERPVWPFSDPPDQYQLTWGDHACDCFEDQLPNFLHCENLTMRPRDLRRLLRGDGFVIRKNGEPLAPYDLSILTNRTLTVRGKRTQLEEQNRFDGAAPFWKELQTGDVVKVTFRAGDRMYFKFNLRLNDRRGSYDYAYLAEWGDLKVAIDMENELGIKYIDRASLNRALAAPLRLVKNGKDPLRVDRLVVNNLGLGMEQALEVASARPFTIQALLPLRYAAPGDRLSFDLETEAGRLQFALVLRPDNLPAERPQQVYQISWGKHQAAMAPPEGVMARSPHFQVSRQELAALKDEPLEVEIAGQPMTILGFDYSFPSGATVVSGAASAIYRRSTDPDWQEKFRQALADAQPGMDIHFYRFRTAEGIQFNLTVTVAVEFFPERYYRHRRSYADYSPKTGIAEFRAPDQLDWSAVRDMTIIPQRIPGLVLDGKKFSGRTMIVDDQRQPNVRQILDLLTPADIRRFTVYLPEAATARVGSLGSGGVLMVETKDTVRTRALVDQLIRALNEKPEPVVNFRFVADSIRIDGEINVDQSEEGLLELAEAAKRETRPLIIIDGRQYSYEEGRPYVQAFSDRQEIAQLTIYKRTAAQRKFGEAAREGAIEITTKEGLSASRAEDGIAAKLRQARQMLEQGDPRQRPLLVIDGQRLQADRILMNLKTSELIGVELLSGSTAQGQFGEEGRYGAVVIQTKRSPVSPNLQADHLKVASPAGVPPSLVEVEASLRVFPNVANEKSTIQFELPEAVSDAELAVFDLGGRELSRLHRGALAAGAQQFTLERGAVGGSGGTYVVRLRLNGEVLTRKVVFQ